MRLAGFVTITRPVNSFVAGLAAIIAYLIDTGTVIPESLLLFFIVALITPAGNVINDFFDAEIDAINRPDRPIPSGAVSRGAAWGFAVTLFLAGIVLALAPGPLQRGFANAMARSGDPGRAESLDNFLQGVFNALAALASLLPGIAGALAVAAAALLAYFWLGTTTLALAFAATERVYAVRGRNQPLIAFGEALGERLAGRGG